MRRLYLLLLMFSPVWLAAPGPCASRYERGTLTYDGIPEAPAGLMRKLDAYRDARQATCLGWSPKGQLLISTRFGDVPQLHLVEQAGGERRQLTFYREPVTEGAFSPDPTRSAFAFLEDAGGNEQAQLYYRTLGDPAARLLSDGKSKNGGLKWSNSGRDIAFYSNARDAAVYDIDVVQVDSGALPRLVVTGDGAATWTPLDWSPDDRKLLVLREVSVNEGYLYVVDIATGERKPIDPAPGKVGIVGARFSRDGRGVYLISDRDGEFAKLRYADLFTSERATLSSQIPWDVEALALTRDGRYLAYVSNEGGLSKLNLLDLRTHQDLTPPHLSAPGIIGNLAFDADGKRLAFDFQAANMPSDVYVLDVASNHLEQWTHSELGPVDSTHFVVPRLTQFPTFDRPDGRMRQEPVYIYEPAAPGPHPVLITVHGGPESQFRPYFSAWLQFVVNELGFAVVAPNVRGSAGYGKSYLMLDNGMLREDAVKDMGALLVWIGSQSEFDAKRVVVSGGSYGGYLALATLVNFNDRLAGAVELSGISNFITFLSTTAPYRQAQRRAEYGDERNSDMRAFLRRASPLTNADRITKPLLVVAGKNDPRVPIAEADQIVNRVRSRGIEVWYLQASDEGHGFRKKSNLDAYYLVFAQFLANLH